MSLLCEYCAHFQIQLKECEGYRRQGRRKLPRVGRLIDQSVDAPEGSEVEARCAIIPREARKNFFRLHFQLSGWALVALSYFED